MKMNYDIIVPVVLVLIIFGTMFLGCKTLQGGGSTVLVETALATATYAVVKNNPEFKAPLIELAEVLEDLSGALSPDALEARLQEHVTGLSPMAMTAITAITRAVVDAYGRIWQAKVNEFSATQYGQVLTAMGRAIRTGASATEFSTASPPVEFTTSKGLILIN